MESWSIFANKVSRLLKRRRLERDLDDEVAFHLAMREQKLREQGATAEDAQVTARRTFGNAALVRETTRDQWMFRWLERLAQDIRYAARSMGKSPAVTAVVVLSLALGIGANTAIFTLIDAVMLRMLPVREPQQLVVLERQVAPGRTTMGFTNPLWEAIRAHQDVFSGMVAFGNDVFDLAQGGAVQNAQGLEVNGDYFNALGIVPAAGRLFSAADDQRGCAPTAVLSYAFWQSHYGGADSAVGSTISLKRQAFQVIGVSAPGFTGAMIGSSFDVAVPICATAYFDTPVSRLDQRSWWWMNIMGRMKPGVTTEQVNSRMAQVSRAIMMDALPLNWDAKSQQNFLKVTLVTVPAGTGWAYLKRQFAQPLNILMAIVALVLLIACANIASLMLARASSRTRELAIRKAMGASRARLVRQLLTESLLLSTIGAAAGLLFARWGSALLVRKFSTERSHIFLNITPDARILGFTAAVAALTGILVGLLPALRSTRVSLMSAMKSTQSVAPERPRSHGGKWIVAAQLAMSLVLLIGGALLLRSFVKLTTLDLGFDRNGVLLVDTSLNTIRVPVEARAQLLDDIGDRLRSVPAVSSVARCYTTPVSGRGWNTDVVLESGNGPTGDQSLTWFNTVTPDFFSVMRIPLLAGRGFTDHDNSSAPLIALVDQTFVQRFFPKGDAIGKRFHMSGNPGEPTPLIEIAGIVRNSKYGSVREDAEPTAFFPSAQIAQIAPIAAARGNVLAQTFAIRTSAPPSSVVTAVQQAFASVNKSIPLVFRTLAEQVDDNLVQERLLATLSGFFGGLALLLAMIGLYGVLSYLVTQRQVEFGIRMALGAQPVSILRLVMRDVVLLLVVGIAAGTGIALATTRLLQKMLFGLQPHDAATILIAVGLLSALALVAGYLPAHRATRVDPMQALRYE